MKREITLTAVLLVLCMFAVTNLAKADAINIDQDWIDGNRGEAAPHWTLDADNTYTVIENVTFNGELHLEAGTELILDGNVLFSGAAAAITTPGNGERISINADWNAITFANGCASSNLERVDLQLFDQPFTIGDCDGFTFEDCTISPLDGWENYDQWPGIEIIDNNTQYLISGCTFTEMSLFIECGEVEVFGCDFEFRDTPLTINGRSEVVVRGFSTFTQTNNRDGYCIEINPSNYDSHWWNPVSVEIYDCEFTDDSEAGSSGILITSFPSDSIEIYRCLIHKLTRGISVEIDADHGAEDGGIMIRNNLLEDLADKGVYVDDEHVGGGISLRNNIIHYVTNEGIYLDDASDVSVRYNTISHAANCIWIDLASDELIYDNVFANWSGRAVGYNTRGNGAYDPVDYNVYCTPPNTDPEDPPGTAYLWNCNSPDNGPQEVLEAKEDRWQYFPWGEENDDIDCDIRDDDGAPPHDFHLIGTRNSYPSWLDQVHNDDTEPDRPLIDPGIWPRPRQLRPIQTFLADAGAYSGPYSEYFAISNEYGNCDFAAEYEAMWGQYITDEETHDASHFADPFVWIIADQLQWLYDGGEAPEGEYYRALGDLGIEDGDERFIPTAVCIAFEDGIGMEVDYVLECDGDPDEEVELIGYGYNWDGVSFTSNAVLTSCKLEYTKIRWANYGLYLVDLSDIYGNRLPIDHCTIDSCDIGIYANDSRVEITDTEISECTGDGSSSYGNAVYLTSCTSGQVIIDGCDIHDNGYGGTYSSAAIYLNSSDAEIINTEVYDNSGVGIACFGSSPDLDAYDYILYEELSNEIRDNGPSSPTGSNGAEIYLDGYSTPVIKYNNVYDCVPSPFAADGYAVYMDILNQNNITARYNWWGTNYPDTYESSLFYEGAGSVGSDVYR